MVKSDILKVLVQARKLVVKLQFMAFSILWLLWLFLPMSIGRLLPYLLMVNVIWRGNNPGWSSGYVYVCSFYCSSYSKVGRYCNLRLWCCWWFSCWIGGNLELGFDCHVNVSKSWLVIKDDCYYATCDLFVSLQITNEGRPYLGAPPEFASTFIQDKVPLWRMMSRPTLVNLHMKITDFHFPSHLF